MTQIVGILPDKVTPAASTPEFKLGTIAAYDHPTLGYQEFVYGRANGAITGLGYMVGELTGFDFVQITTTNTIEGVVGQGSRVAAAQATMADNDCGWFQVYGKGSVRTLASAARNARLNTTASGGQLDDDGTAGARVVAGVTLLTPTGGAAAANADAMLVNPFISITL